MVNGISTVKENPKTKEVLAQRLNLDCFVVLPEYFVNWPKNWGVFDYDHLDTSFIAFLNHSMRPHMEAFVVYE